MNIPRLNRFDLAETSSARRFLDSLASGFGPEQLAYQSSARWLYHRTGEQIQAGAERILSAAATVLDHGAVMVGGRHDGVLYEYHVTRSDGTSTGVFSACATTSACAALMGAWVLVCDPENSLPIFPLELRNREAMVAWAQRTPGYHAWRKDY